MLQNYTFVRNFLTRAFKNPGFPPSQFSPAMGKKIKDRSRLDFSRKRALNLRAFSSYLLRVVLFRERPSTKYAVESGALRASVVQL